MTPSCRSLPCPGHASILWKIPCFSLCLDFPQGKKKKRKKRKKRGSTNFVCSSYFGIFKWNSWIREHPFFLHCKYFKVMNIWTRCFWDTGRFSTWFPTSVPHGWSGGRASKTLRGSTGLFRLPWGSRTWDFQPAGHTAEILEPLESTGLHIALSVSISRWGAWGFPIGDLRGIRLPTTGSLHFVYRPKFWNKINPKQNKSQMKAFWFFFPSEIFSEWKTKHWFFYFKTKSC